MNFESDWAYSRVDSEDEATEGHWKVCLEIAKILESK